MTDKLRRYLLRPLARKARESSPEAFLKSALEHLEARAFGEHLLDELRVRLQRDRGNHSRRTWQDSETVRDSIDIASILYRARRLTKAEYVFHACTPVESLHESRAQQGAYDADLKPIQDRLEVIEREHGLREDEFWPRGQGPEEWQRLNDQYEQLLDARLIETLRTFNLDSLATLKEENPEEFNELRERGRRMVFHRDELELAIRDIVVRYEWESALTASAGAYSAAIATLGAAVEGLLVLRCLRSPKKSKRIAHELPAQIRPRAGRGPADWPFATLVEVCLRAGWLPPFETDVARFDPAGMASLIRRMRNSIHPGRHAREQPWVAADERDYQDAVAIHAVLVKTLAGNNSAGRKRSARRTRSD